MSVSRGRQRPWKRLRRIFRATSGCVTIMPITTSLSQCLCLAAAVALHSHSACAIVSDLPQPSSQRLSSAAWMKWRYHRSWGACPVRSRPNNDLTCRGHSFSTSILGDMRSPYISLASGRVVVHFWRLMRALTIFCDTWTPLWSMSLPLFASSSATSFPAMSTCDGIQRRVMWEVVFASVCLILLIQWSGSFQFPLSSASTRDLLSVHTIMLRSRCHVFSVLSTHSSANSSATHRMMSSTCRQAHSGGALLLL